MNLNLHCVLTHFTLNILLNENINVLYINILYTQYINFQKFESK